MKTLKLRACEVWEMRKGRAEDIQAVYLCDCGGSLLGWGDKGSCCRRASYHRLLTSMQQPKKFTMFVCLSLQANRGPAELRATALLNPLRL